jgi:hypothetical protein
MPIPMRTKPATSSLKGRVFFLGSLLVAFVFTSFASSCGEQTADENNIDAPTEQTELEESQGDATGPNSASEKRSNEDKLGLRTSTNSSEQGETTHDAVAGRRYTADEINGPYSTVSPWRYIVTSPEMLRFAKLVSGSDYARKIHAGGYIVLAPENAAFDKDKAWKLLLKHDRKSDLNAFVEQYILEGPATGKSLKGRQTDLAGNAVDIVDKDGDLFLGDGHLASRQVATDAGLIVPLTTLIAPIKHSIVVANED